MGHGGAINPPELWGEAVGGGVIGVMAGAGRRTMVAMNNAESMNDRSEAGAPPRKTTPPRKSPPLGEDSHGSPHFGTARSSTGHPTEGRGGRGSKASAGTGKAPGRVRLHKLLAQCGVGSRRRCEELIQKGAVLINGEPLMEFPAWVDPETDRIEVEGKRIEAKERKIYVMLYKPKNTVTTLSDPEGRRTVTELVEHPAGVRLYPVGRLDYDTLGLILMTNDGELANRLTHPRYGVHKTYRAIVRGSLSDDDVEKLREGIVLAQRKAGKTVGAERLGATEIEIIRREPTRTILQLTLTEGRNRQVRRILAAVGCHVKKLTRVRVGPVSLKGLQIGEWRELTLQEIRSLRRASDPKLSQAEREEAQQPMMRRDTGGRSKGDRSKVGRSGPDRGGSDRGGAQGRGGGRAER